MLRAIRTQSEGVGNDMKSILFYGDSNTWGFDPSTTLRYPNSLRWTTVCAGILGSGYNCIPSGMNGRTTVFDDPQKGCRNGIKGLDYELQTHKPLDLFAVMLGTNDLKYTDAQGTAKGMERLIALVLNANERYNLSSPVFPEGPRILLISPILLKAHVGGRENDIAYATQLAGLYESIAAAHNLAFLDAAQYTEPSDIDGVHLGVEGHRILGETIAEKIKSLAL